MDRCILTTVFSRKLVIAGNKVMKQYNKLLDELFARWIQVADATKFCKDGLMLKYGQSPEYVDEQWEKASRRILFLVKDNNDGWGHDTRTWLVDGDEAENSRNLSGGRVGQSGFLPNIAKMFYGLMTVQPGHPANYDQVCEEMDKVRDMFNTAPFAFVEAKKAAGGKTVASSEVTNAMEKDKEFLKDELDILRPNIIVCCDAEDSQFNFVTQYYLAGREPEKFDGAHETYPDARHPYCLWFYDSENPEERIAVIKSYHPSNQGKENWKIHERVVSSMRALLQKHSF